MRTKFIGVGLLIGFLFGIAIVFFFPQLLTSATNSALNPVYPKNLVGNFVTYGSTYNLLPGTAALFALLGGLLGFLLSLPLNRKRSSRKR